MRSIGFWCTTLLLALSAALFAPLALQAQDQGEEEPGMRIVTVTTFKVPFYDRDKVFPFMRRYVLPAAQLNPNVLNYRVLWHNWGADASQVIISAEYEDITKIEAECGQPCSDYFEANPEPEEGDEGYETFRQQEEAFAKYYAQHSDEIYVTPMGAAKIEGQMQGRVGMSDEM